MGTRHQAAACAATLGDSPGCVSLPHGHRWHTPVHIGALEPDKDPAVALHNAISDRLLPVFRAKPFYALGSTRTRAETDFQAGTDQPAPAKSQAAR
jgi:hypothetical protein